MSEPNKKPTAEELDQILEALLPTASQAVRSLKALIDADWARGMPNEVLSKAVGSLNRSILSAAELYAVISDKESTSRARAEFAAGVSAAMMQTAMLSSLSEERVRRVERRLDAIERGPIKFDPSSN